MFIKLSLSNRLTARRLGSFFIYGPHVGHTLLGFVCTAQCCRGGDRRLGSIPAHLGVLILGIGETFLVALGYSTFSNAFTFILLIIMLIVRPTGLFGEKIIDKV